VGPAKVTLQPRREAPSCNRDCDGRSPHSGLALLESLDKDERLAGSHRLTAVRAHLLERAGDREGAIPFHREAAARTTSIPERNYLPMRAGRLSE
jgi:predicted RNA polymerase sigma factor